MRPWNEFIAVIMTGTSISSLVCAYLRVNLIAASLASAPELQKNALSAHECCISHLARAACSGI